ncbi:glutathione binding-like protein [Pantoea agglomerans]|uniref:glutathione binding-like protein n=1 Tax=Enterobacter agglomerans TaxID=549 RepID=UPI003C7B2F8D
MQLWLWLGKAAGEIRYGPDSARLIKLFGADEDYDFASKVATRLLSLMEQHIHTCKWLASSFSTIANVAFYVYLAAAHEGGLSLRSYPEITVWLRRVESLPGFVPFTKPEKI